MYDERRASIRALEYARSSNIFSNNDNLKRFYSECLKMKMDCPDAFGPGESEIVTDLDQDWHY